MSKQTISQALAIAAASGEGSPASPAADHNQTIIIIRDFTPGQIVRVVFISPEQAKSLPLIPQNALQIAVAPAGGN